MKNFLSLLLAVLLVSRVQAQSIINYGPNGEKTKSLSEYVEITLEPTSSEESFGNPMVLAGLVVGPVYSIVSSTIKKSLDKRQKKFVAAYSNSVEFSEDDLKQSGQKRMVLYQNLVINRYAINALNQVDYAHLMATYFLRLTPSTAPDRFLLQLHTIILKRAKAKYRTGEHLSISLTIKATAQQKTPTKDATKDKPEIVTREAEGTMVIPLVQVSEKEQDLTPYGNVINPISLNDIDLSAATSLKLSVSITETNVNHLTNSETTTILLDNASDIQTILKTVFGIKDK